MSRPLPFSKLIRASGLGLVLAGLASLPGPLSAQPTSIPRVADAEQIHALVIGIDDYRHLPRLRGAVADARDIETSLRALGVSDISVLIDDAADRDSILAAVENLRARVRPGDLVILSLAGHGAQEPERVKGSSSDGKDVVFLLAGFDTAARATTQRILDMEFKHFIKELEAAGARVLFIADTCSGGGLARDVDPRAAEVIYRAVPTYRISDDELKPVSTPADAFTTELDFERTIFLAAADRNTKAPEIKVPGVEGYRGALSYAVARGLQGDADADKDGRIVVEELFDYVRELTYQLSDQRQNIVSLSTPGIATEPVVRSVTVSGPLMRPQSPIEPVEFTPPRPSISTQPPVRVAILGGDSSKLTGVSPIETRFEIVPLFQNPELIWDVRKGEVISGGGDVVAQGIVASDLPSVVDRTAAVRALKQIIARSVQTVRLLPDSGRHKRGKRIEIEVDVLTGRTLLLFNIAGDGTVQLLYPTAADPKEVSSTPFHLPIEVREPFGADQVVAITASHPLPELEQALRRASDRRASAKLVAELARADQRSLSIGSIGVFTAP